MSIVSLAREGIRSLHAYEAAAQVDDTIRLNANESPLASPIGNFRRPLNRYPEVRPAELQSKLATRFGCEADELLVTRGSSEAIDLVVRTFCEAGKDSIVIPAPSFSMYRHYAKVQGARIVEVATRADDDFAIDTSTLLEACDEATKVVFVCSPNNPTGTPLPREQLLELLNGRMSESAIVVDEAYVEFGRQGSVADLLAEFPNLLILRTLSKALGFAGARCGAVIGRAEVIRLLNAVQAPYALATPVVECVEDALSDEQLTLAEGAVAQVIVERDRLAAAIAGLGYVEKVWPSEANFFLVRVTNPAAVMQRCREERVLLRDFSSELPGCIRITVGSNDENTALLRVLQKLEGEAK